MDFKRKTGSEEKGKEDGARGESACRGERDTRRVVPDGEAFTHPFVHSFIHILHRRNLESSGEDKCYVSTVGRLQEGDHKGLWKHRRGASKFDWRKSPFKKK